MNMKWRKKRGGHADKLFGGEKYEGGDFLDLEAKERVRKRSWLGRARTPQLTCIGLLALLSSVPRRPSITSPFPDQYLRQKTCIAKIRNFLMRLPWHWLRH